MSKCNELQNYIPAINFQLLQVFSSNLQQVEQVKGPLRRKCDPSSSAGQ